MNITGIRVALVGVGFAVLTGAGWWSLYGWEGGWEWLKDEDNQRTIGFIAAGYTGLVKVVWEIYKFKKETKSSSPGIQAGGNITAETSGNGHAIVAGGPVIITGISLAEHEASLKRREQEIRTELQSEYTQGRNVDQKRIRLLEEKLADVESRLSNPELSREQTIQVLQASSDKLSEFADYLSPEQIRQARNDLQKGNTSRTEALLVEVFSRSRKHAADAAWQLAELTHNRIDYDTAWHYYREAVRLQPDNPF